MPTQRELNAEAGRLARLLRERQLKIVLAESCTGGLVSAALTTVPGISAYHCGSAVVYQVETKASWLGISRELLKKPGPVSRAVAGEMARTILEKTPHADLAAAVTGHLGPDAPPRQDGLVYIAVAFRRSARKAGHTASPPAERPRTFIERHRLPAEPNAQSAQGSKRRLRARRQRAAALLVLRTISARLEEVL